MPSAIFRCWILVSVCTYARLCVCVSVCVSVCVVTNLSDGISGVGPHSPGHRRHRHLRHLCVFQCTYASTRVCACLCTYAPVHVLPCTCSYANARACVWARVGARACVHYMHTQPRKKDSEHEKRPGNTRASIQTRKYTHTSRLAGVGAGRCRRAFVHKGAGTMEVR